MHCHWPYAKLFKVDHKKTSGFFNLYQAAASIGHLSPWTLDIAGFKLGDLRLWGWQGIKWRSKCFCG